MKGKRKIVGILFLCFLLFGCGRDAGETVVADPLFQNLTQLAGTIVTADSKTQEACYCVDDQVDERCWISADAGAGDGTQVIHYVDVAFRESQQVGYIRMVWEQLNAKKYAIEISEDGLEYSAVECFETTPYLTEQLVELPNDTQAKHVRLAIYEVMVNDMQSYEVSLREFQIYSENPWSQVFSQICPSVKDAEEGRILVEEILSRKVERQITVVYAGCDYSQVVGEDRTVFPILEGRTVHIGYHLTYRDWTMDSPEYPVMVEPVDPLAEVLSGANERPSVIPGVQEWKGDTGAFHVSEQTRILCDDSLEEIGKQLQRDISILIGNEPELLLEKTDELQVQTKTGDIILAIERCDETAGLGEEGYRMLIDDTIKLWGEQERGVFWGTQTLLQMIEGDRIPRGCIRDYPQYEVRGVELDVARNDVSLGMLRQLSRSLAWYKMNELTLHLNDNVMLMYSTAADYEDTVFDAFSAFRLEADLCNAEGERLTSEDYYYSKQDFADFVEESKQYGVDIIPEIDTPAHSLALTRLFPDMALKGNRKNYDILDLEQPETLELVQNLFREYLDGENAAFASCDTIHIGADEYFGKPDFYLLFEHQMISFIQSYEKRARMWASLGGIKSSGTFRIAPESVELIFWNAEWANPRDLYHAGFDLINANNEELYLIPGSGWDYLDTKKLYEEFTVNKFPMSDGTKCKLPSYSPSIKGAQVTLWNDACEDAAIGISEFDMAIRMLDAMPAVASKLWRTDADRSCEYEAFQQLAQKLERVPGIDPLSRSGGLRMGPPYEMTFYVTLSETDMQRDKKVFEVHENDNDYIFWARTGKEGKVGFSREGDDYLFDYCLPVNETVELRVVGEPDKTSLYVNGELMDTVGSSEHRQMHATFTFPMIRVE